MTPEIHSSVKTLHRPGRGTLLLFPTRPINRKRAVRLPHSTRLTTDPEEIRRWVEARGGRPAAVAPLLQDEFGLKAIGALRIAFPEEHDKENLEMLPWETFFETFEARSLAFLYQERTATGEQSRFNKFIKQETFTYPGRLERAV